MTSTPSQTPTPVLTPDSPQRPLRHEHNAWHGFYLLCRNTCRKVCSTCQDIWHKACFTCHNKACFTCHNAWYCSPLYRVWHCSWLYGVWYRSRWFSAMQRFRSSDDYLKVRAKNRGWIAGLIVGGFAGWLMWKGFLSPAFNRATSDPTLFNSEQLDALKKTLGAEESAKLESQIAKYHQEDVNAWRQVTAYIAAAIAFAVALSAFGKDLGTRVSDFNGTGKPTRFFLGVSQFCTAFPESLAFVTVAISFSSILVS